MPENHPLADHKQPVFLCASGCRWPEAQPLGRTPEQQRIPDRLGRCDQQQQPGVVRQWFEPAYEALLDPAWNRVRRRHSEPACKLRRGEPARQLKQRQRIAPRLRDDPVPNSLIQHELHSRSQQHARVVVTQAVHLEPRNVVKLVARLACAEHDPDWLCQQTTGDER